MLHESEKLGDGRDEKRIRSFETRILKYHGQQKCISNPECQKKTVIEDVRKMTL